MLHPWHRHSHLGRARREWRGCKRGWLCSRFPCSGVDKISGSELSVAKTFRGAFSNSFFGSLCQKSVYCYWYQSPCVKTGYWGSSWIFGTRAIARTVPWSRDAESTLSKSNLADWANSLPFLSAGISSAWTFPSIVLSCNSSRTSQFSGHSAFLG